MSNRRKLRNPEVLEFRVVDSLAAALSNPAGFHCPDCDSELSAPVVLTDSHARIEIHHDDTCPWLNARTTR